MERIPVVVVARNMNLPWKPAETSVPAGVRTPFARRVRPYELAGLLQATVEANATLEATIVAAAVVAQRVRSLAVVLEEALVSLTVAEDDPISHQPAASAGTALAGSLSPREREVLALVAAGHTNKAIAEQLFVSPNTIKTHVASLLQKLDADSRVELAAIATRHRVDKLPKGNVLESATRLPRGA